MRWIDQLVLQLRSLFRRARVEQELDAELRFHLEQQIDEHVAAGMSAIEARSAALRSLGSLTRVKEQCRDSLGVRLADDLRQDLRQATRTFTKHPGFALIAVLILTLGIGVNTAIFSVLNAASLRASAIRDPDRVAFIWTTPSGHPESSEGVRLAEYYFWKAQSRAFDRLGIMLAWSSTVGPIQDGMPAERLSGWRFSASMFDGLDVQPELGRLFTEEEDRTDGPSNVVVISDRLWQSHFGGDPSVLNRTLLMDGTTTTIIGVMPPTFNFFGSNFDFWLPQNFTRFQMQARSPSRVPMAIGRVKP